MNYAKYVPVDFVNGVGVRCTLFVTGCQHKCKGCYNKTTWNPREGFTFTQEMEDQIIKDLKCTKLFVLDYPLVVVILCIAIMLVLS